MRPLLVFVLLGSTACGSNSTSADAPTDSTVPADVSLTDSATTDTPSADTAASGDSVSSEEGATDAGPTRYCTATCKVPADCAIDEPPFIASNYACESGVCRFLGCKSDAECNAPGSTGSACRTTTELFPTCSPTCVTPADCALDSGAYNTANYACDSGVCTYLGCKDDTECKSSFKTPTLCAKPPFPSLGSPATKIPFCVTSCATASDCARPGAPAYGAENFSCRDGACAYEGCRSDSECTATFGTSNYVCH